MAETANSTTASFCAAQDGIMVADLTIPALYATFRALSAAHDAMEGIYNTPFTKAGAHSFIEPELIRLTDQAQAIVEEMRARRPADDDETRQKGEVLIVWGLRCGSWSDVGNAYVAATSRHH